VAHIDSTHGLDGEVSAVLHTDFPQRFKELESVRVGAGEEEGSWRRLALEGWRLHRGKVLLKLEGVEDVEAARALVGCDVCIEAGEAMELPPDSYYQDDLLGLRVRDRGGRQLGVVEDILRTGAADILVVRQDGEEYLIPAARSICVEVDLAAGELVVDPPEGLLEINAG
jgi:16S rRNA processing protein RimM